MDASACELWPHPQVAHEWGQLGPRKRTAKQATKESGSESDHRLQARWEKGQLRKQQETSEQCLDTCQYSI